MKNYTSGVPVETTIARRAQLIKNLGTGMLGKSHSEETKRKIGQANKGMVRSEEVLKKMSESHKGVCAGEKHPAWKGGQWTDKDGRIYVLLPDHPHANNKGYIFRARLVMEGILKRYLLSEEVVHHRNEITNDDRPENLDLFSSKGAHISFHNLGKDRSGKRSTAIKGNGFKMLPQGRPNEEEK